MKFIKIWCIYYSLLTSIFSGYFFSSVTTFSMQKVTIEGADLDQKYVWEIDATTIPKSVSFNVIRGGLFTKKSFSQDDIDRKIESIKTCESDTRLRDALIKQLNEAWDSVSSFDSIHSKSPQFIKALYYINIIENMIYHNYRTISPQFGEKILQKKPSYRRSILFGASLVGLAGGLAYWNRSSIQDSVSTAVGSLLAHDIFKVDWSEFFPKQPAPENVAEQFISFVNWLKPEK